MLLLSDIVSQKVPPRVVAAQKVLITGPVGVGKTTVAKALAAKRMGVEEAYLARCQELACDSGNMSYRDDISDAFPFDFFHINGGDDGIDRIRELAVASTQQPFDPRCRCRAFVVDEIHALPEKAVQALLLPLERDTKNLWVACTSRPASALDAALRSRFAVHLELGAADVEAVGRSLGWADSAQRARASNGDLRIALSGETAACSDIDDKVITVLAGAPKITVRGNVGARLILAQALRNPAAYQARILDALVDFPEQHTAMCLQLSPRNDVAAHQLLAAARRARLL